MKKHSDKILAVTLLVAFLAVWILIIFIKDPSKAEPQTQNSSRPKKSQPPPATSRFTRDNRKEILDEFDILAEQVTKPKNTDNMITPEFRTGGKLGGKLTVRNSRGELIIRGDEKTPIFGAKGSPDNQLIWIQSGDGKSFIIDAAGTRITDLPQFPEGENVHAFSRWHWVDHKHLLGEAGVQKFDEEGKLVACCQGDIVSETRLFTFDLDDKIVRRVQLPNHLQGKVVNIERILETGEIFLGHPGDQFSWFKLVDLSR